MKKTQKTPETKKFEILNRQIFRAHRVHHFSYINYFNPLRIERDTKPSFRGGHVLVGVYCVLTMDSPEAHSAIIARRIIHRPITFIFRSISIIRPFFLDIPSLRTPLADSLCNHTLPSSPQIAVLTHTYSHSFSPQIASRLGLLHSLKSPPQRSRKCVLFMFDMYSSFQLCCQM